MRWTKGAPPSKAIPGRQLLLAYDVEGTRHYRIAKLELGEWLGAGHGELEGTQRRRWLSQPGSIDLGEPARFWELPTE